MDKAGTDANTPATPSNTHAARFSGTMDSDGEIAASEYDGGWSTAEPVPNLEETLEQLRQNLAAWCIARPDPSALSIGAVYEELAYLDAKQQSVLPDEDLDEHCGWPPRPKPAALVLRHAKRDEASRGVAARRQLLRSRALELSRGGLRPLKVIDLPLEILHLIFSGFQHDAITEAARSDLRVDLDYYRVGEDERRRRTVRKLRLVCRRFCELATPLLFPILRVQLSQASLDFADKVSKNPGMAAGVRGICIYLGYRPKVYAESIARYRDARLGPLKRLARRCEREYRQYKRRDSNDESENEVEGEEEEDQDAVRLRQVLEECGRLRHAWSEYVDEGVHLGEATEILTKGYAEFCRLHQEQRRLLGGGTFANSLASAVARVPNACSIAFVEAWGDDKEMPLPSNREALSRFMSSPLSWRQIEDEREEQLAVDLDCARILWELPIALHRAGAVLVGMQINNLPLYGNFSALHAQDEKTGAPAWDELSAACQHLETFDLRTGNCKGLRANYLPAHDKSHVDGFLGAILSRCGPHLRVLNLDFYALCINTGMLASNYEGSYHSDSYLRRLQPTPRLRRLRLNHVELQRDTVNAFCDNLGSNLSWLDMHDVNLHGGSWADAVDTLRGKMAPESARPHAGSCSLTWLQGGEFVLAGEGPETEGELDTDDDTEPLPFDSNPRAKRLWAATGKYVEGVLEHNPLRDRTGG